MAEATSQAQDDPLFLQLKMLDVELGRIEKWDGRYPSYLMQMGPSGEGTNVLLQLPPVAAK